MELPALLPISSSGSASNTVPFLRPFQRVTARVLTVTGTIALLSIDGHPVVARLTSADQAAALSSRQTAHFIVSKITGQEITLRFIRQDQTGAVTANPPPRGPELAVRLLEQHHIPLNANTMMLARTVLNQGLPLTPGLLNELLSALSEFGPWGQPQADLAAALKAAGLPVSAHSVALAARQAAQSGEALGGLIAQLQSAGQNLPPDLLKEIHRNLHMLEELVLRMDGDTARLAAQLKTAVNVLGQSLESALLEQSQQLETISSGKGLFSLVRLQQSLSEAGETELAATVERFLGDLRHHQLLNAKPEPDLGQVDWSEIGFRLAGERGASVRLRIGREANAKSGEAVPIVTRLVLQVDVSESEAVEVDLALAGKDIRAQMTTADPTWRRQAEGELPSLEEALQSLGFRLHAVKIDVGEPQPFEKLKLATSHASLITVNIEV